MAAIGAIEVIDEIVGAEVGHHRRNPEHEIAMQRTQLDHEIEQNALRRDHVIDQRALDRDLTRETAEAKNKTNLKAGASQAIGGLGIGLGTMTSGIISSKNQKEAAEFVAEDQLEGTKYKADADVKVANVTAEASMYKTKTENNQNLSNTIQTGEIITAGVPEV